ncbi:C2 family cysteine protease [Actinomadura sp. B10D3]|uniref:C2 family cysteine protease n=1 Tax=Actinomadura sp. B10D3 TaxID=3153557 RepID=UPI00325E5A82
MGVEHPTGTDTKLVKPDHPKPPAPPPDNPGSPGQPSRTESRSRSQEPASAQPDRDQKTDASEPEAKDKPQTAGNSPAEQDEPTDSSTSAKPQHTLPPDNPGSPSQPSRLESLARAREPVHQNEPQHTEPEDNGTPPTEERKPHSEAKPTAEDGRSAAGEKPEAADESVSPGQKYTLPSDNPGSPSQPSRLESLARAREPVQQENDNSKPEDADGAEPTGTEPQDAPKPADTIPDDLDRRISGDGPPDDNWSAADVDEDELERGIADRLKQVAVKLDLRREPKELAGTVDHPDFQDPKEDPKNIPDRYGTPLDRPDGSRTPLFDGRPKREQVEQGALGDCGVIATLGAVAGHHPEAIRDCVRETDDGNYQVRLHEAKYSTSKQRYEPTGRPITLTVTPDLPIDDEYPGVPAFADDPSSGAAWLSVLEKAIAGMDQTWPARRRRLATELWNVRGNTGDAPTGYVRLNQGSNPAERAELLTQLTGRPAKTVQFPADYDNQGRTADQRLHDEIVDQLSQNKPVIVGTRTPLKGEPPLPGKLIKGHAYEVIKVDDQGRLHLRNPWNDRHPEPMNIREFRAGIRPRYSTLE